MCECVRERNLFFSKSFTLILSEENISYILQEKMCEESTSFDLTPYDLTSAIDAVDKLLKEQASDIGKGEPSEDFNAVSLNSGLAHEFVTDFPVKSTLMC